MRPKIVALDVDTIEWAPLGPPGLFSRLLSRDPETGARTALQQLDPTRGYQAPTVAHFHTTYEEILGVSGHFTFDHRTWVRPGTYVFHPPRTVHGFKSAVLEPSTFLSRVGRDLDVNLVHEPSGDDLYVIEGPVPPRLPVAHGDPLATVGFAEATLLGAPVQACLLSRDPESGEGSALVRLPSDWHGEATMLDVYLELFVFEGGIGVGNGPVEARRDYFFYPPGESVDPLRTDAATLAYVNFGGAVGI